jgi:8-oxo-dGTP diphosphatase
VPWTATNSEGFESPVALAVDVVVLTVLDANLVVLATTSGDQHFLPGGLVAAGEDLHDAAIRVLGAKAGLPSLYLEQLAAFAAPDRDPRGWIPAISYLALVPPSTALSDDKASWVPVHGRHQWAYDHGAMVEAAIDRVEGKLWWSNVAVGILSGPFSMSDARTVYSAISGVTYDGATFARDLKATGLVEPTGESRSEGRGRPAALYRFSTNRPAWGSGRRKRVAGA